MALRFLWKCLQKNLLKKKIEIAASNQWVVKANEDESDRVLAPLALEDNTIDRRNSGRFCAILWALALGTASCLKVCCLI